MYALIELGLTESVPESLVLVSEEVQKNIN